MSIHDPAWPEQRANIHRALDVVRLRDAMGLFANGWLMSIQPQRPSAEERPQQPHEDRKQ